MNYTKNTWASLIKLINSFKINNGNKEKACLMVHKTAHYFALNEGSRENPCREMTPQISVILT